LEAGVVKASTPFVDLFSSNYQAVVENRVLVGLAAIFQISYGLFQLFCVFLNFKI
jgi:hypothetical protein